MRHFLFFILALSFAIISSSQTIDRQPVCDTDTITVHPDRRLYFGRDSLPYRAFNCTYTSWSGVRFEMGFSYFDYQGATSNWMGPHEAFVLGIGFDIHKFLAGVRLKAWTVHPAKKLAFAGDSLYTDADVNPNKYEFYIGYAFDLKNNFSFEPTIGYTKSWFEVIDEESFNKSYNIRSSKGIVLGLMLNKYFRLKDRNYLAFYIHGNYATTNFRRTHPELGRGYFEYGAGLAYKLFGKAYSYKRIP